MASIHPRKKHQSTLLFIHPTIGINNTHTDRGEVKRRTQEVVNWKRTRWKKKTTRAIGWCKKKRVYYYPRRLVIRYTTSMNTSSATNKRTAGTRSPRKSAVKKKQKDNDEMEVEIQKLVDAETLVNTDTVPTTIVPRLYPASDHIQMFAPADQEDELMDLAKKPFSGLFGTGIHYVHTDLAAVTRTAAKILVFKRALDSGEATKLLQDGISQEDWVRFFPTLVIKQHRDEFNVQQLCTDAEITQAIVFGSRLAHTAPSHLFGQIKNNAVAANHRTNAWYGAVMTFGSWYNEILKTKKKQATLKNSLLRAEEAKGIKSQKKTPPTPDPRKTMPRTAASTQDEEETGETETTANAHSPVDTQENTQEESVTIQDDTSPKAPQDTTESTNQDAGQKQTSHGPSSPSQADREKARTPERRPAGEPPGIASPPDLQNISKKKPARHLTMTTKEKASAVAARRKFQSRLQVRLQMPDKAEDKTVGTQGLELVQSMFEHFQYADEKCVLLPWKESDMALLPAIKLSTGFPTKLSEFRPYADKFRPLAKAGIWVKIRIASQEPGETFTSKDGSDCQDWFDDNDSMAFLCSVQNSEDVVKVGTFIYSGPFINHRRLQDEIVADLQAYKAIKEWKIGVRIQRQTKMEQTTKGHWVLADNQLATIEADSAQAQTIAYRLTKRFNDSTNNPQRPGNYENLRFAAEPDYITSGTSHVGSANGMLKKHTAILCSLDLLTTDCIKRLDTIDPATQKSLRTVLCSLTHPLVPKKGQRTSLLLHSIDWAASGRDAGTKVYITAYKDRAPLVRKLIQILPTFVAWYEANPALVTAWFNPQLDPPDVTFGEDANGAWDGEWTTAHDEAQQNLIDEYMGIDIQLDNMELLDTSRPIYRADEMSIGSAYQPPPPANGQEDDDSSTASALSKVTREGGSNT